MKHIYIIACGGTIAGKAASADDLTGYKAGEMTIDELLDAVPQARKYAAISGEQFCNIDSSDMTEALWIALAKRVQAIADRDDVDGIVITHGTDTMEETAYFLHLTVHTDKPIVFTGAMRPATGLSADGPVNLLDAICAASDPVIGTCGVVLVLNGRICSARFAAKTDTTHADTFTGRQAGFLGCVQDGKVFFYQQPARRHTSQSDFSCQAIDKLPPVVIIYTYTGMNSGFLVQAAISGVQAIVIAGLGHGKMPVSVWETAQRIMDKGVVLVRSARAMGGIVTAVPQYGDTVCSDDLTPQKAKILTQLALTKTRDTEEIQEIFNQY